MDPYMEILGPPVGRQVPARPKPAYDADGRVLSESGLSNRKDFTYNGVGEMTSAADVTAGGRDSGDFLPGMPIIDPRPERVYN